MKIRQNTNDISDEYQRTAGLKPNAWFRHAISSSCGYQQLAKVLNNKVSDYHIVWHGILLVFEFFIFQMQSWTCGIIFRTSNLLMPWINSLPLANALVWTSKKADLFLSLLLPWISVKQLCLQHMQQTTSWFVLCTFGIFLLHNWTWKWSGQLQSSNMQQNRLSESRSMST